MYHQDTKGVWWMPWHRKLMKDVASCDKPCGAASGLGSTDLRMGKPGTGHAVSPAPEHIGCEEGTRGNDTSEYPEGEIAQTGCVKACGRCVFGVVGPTWSSRRAAWELQNARVAEPVRKV